MFRREHIEEDDIANLSMKNSKDYFYDGKIYTLGVKFFLYFFNIICDYFSVK